MTLDAEGIEAGLRGEAAVFGGILDAVPD